MGLFRSSSSSQSSSSSRDGKRPVILPDDDRTLWLYGSEAKHLDVILAKNDTSKYEDRNR